MGGPVVVLLLVALVVGVVLGVFLMVVVGVRTEDRDASLYGAPRTRAGVATRRLLRLYAFDSKLPICCHSEKAADSDERKK